MLGWLFALFSSVAFRSRKAILLLIRHLFTRRGMLTFSGVLVCCYAVAILWYAQTLADMGIRSAFSPVVKHFHSEYLRPDNQPTPDDENIPQANDRIVLIGDEKVESWPDLVWAPIHINKKWDSEDAKSSRVKWMETAAGDKELWVKVTFERSVSDRDEPVQFEKWLHLGHLPIKELVPSILWFFLKLTLFVVGVLVFWKRPNDPSATQFFILCIVTLGAYMGGYHWAHIVTQPALILGFMLCGVMLPVATLHFYLVFPRAKPILIRHPRWTLLVVYGGPLIFLVAMVIVYACIRLHLGDMATVFEFLRYTIYSFLSVAALWYLASVLCLIHSYRTVADNTERNQIHWILLGALAAMIPISYSLYLAIWKPEAFGAGATTWPMFTASVCFTVAFAISITRYRLMELDKLLSHFLVSFVAGLVYYSVVFCGTLFFNRVIAGPNLTQALTVSTTALVLLLVLDLVRNRFRKALDRRFSRQKLQLDQTLRSMGQAIEQLVEPAALAKRFLQACAELLGVTRGAIYLRIGEPPIYRMTGCLGTPPTLTELSSGCPLIERLEVTEVLLAPIRPGLAADPAQRQLRFLGGEVAQALNHEGKLLALLILGAKDHELYRSEDLNLLAAFAQITVLALENATGHQTIEVLNRDLQTKVEKISEQQRRILALQSQLRKQAPAISIAEKDQAALPALPGDKEKENPAGAIIGSSLPVRHLLELVRKVSASEAVVLLRGESGTGKELLAKALHDNSNRATRPFIKVHCAALSQGLLESELFGHVKGAYTGAHRDKMGRFELANTGTLFLDEIGDINLEVQTKLLRVLQEMTLERVGSSDPIPVDVRIIAATHQNLEELIRQGRFRQDLYYRLNVISITVPPLRDRGEDIPELAMYFLRQYSQRSGKGMTTIDDDALVALKSYPWPGNIRELENVMERAVVVSEDSTITIGDLPAELIAAIAEVSNGRYPEHANGREAASSDAGKIAAEWENRDKQERELLVRALASAEGNKAKAARALGMARSTLLSRLKRHGLN